MAKPLCQRKTQLTQHLEKYLAKVDAPRAICTRCGRVANRRKHLCKAQRIDSRG